MSLQAVPRSFQAGRRLRGLSIVGTCDMNEQHKTGEMKMKKMVVILAAMTSLAAGAWGQTTNTIVAKFAQPPSAEAKFAVSLENVGATKAVSGFAFRICYDPQQVSLDSVTDNTDQPASGVSYTLGPEATGTFPNQTAACKILTMTTSKDLSAGMLAKLNFTKRGPAPTPFRFWLEDREKDPVDGLQGASFENIPHVFDFAQVTGQ